MVLAEEGERTLRAGRRQFGRLPDLVVADAKFSSDTRNRCDVSPEPFLRHALLIGARGIIAFHTHPGGDVTPSAADVAFTGRLVEACDVVGFLLVDHLILGGTGGWVSIRRERRLGTDLGSGQPRALSVSPAG